jgi:hypothetical protein
MEVQWDEQNLFHLLVENGRREISQAEVEEVLMNSRTMQQRLRAGRRRFHGRTNAGRRLTVVVDVLSARRLRPRTAWEA